MASVFKPTWSKKYVILYTDENGTRRKKTGSDDKVITQRIARDFENKVLLRREGLIDAKDESHRDHEAKPLMDHLEAFRVALEARDGTEQHVNLTVARLRMVFELAKVRRISELAQSRIMSAVVVLRTGDKGAETVNHHVRAVKSFARWLWSDGRAREHRLAHLSTSSSAGDRRHVRRALNTEEAARLIQAAASGRDVRGLSGPDRAVLYHLALGTGFHAKELRTLTPDRFNLDANPPTVTARAW